MKTVIAWVGLHRSVIPAMPDAKTGLHSQFQDSLSYAVKPLLKKIKINRERKKSERTGRRAW